MRRFFEKPFHLPNLRTIVPADDDPAIFGLNQDREHVVAEVVRRVTERRSRDRTSAEIALNDVATTEARRLERQRDAESQASLGYYRSLTRRIARMSDDDKRAEIRALGERMARDVAGNFDPRVYRIGEHVVPRLLTGIMSPSLLPKELLDPGASRVDDLITTEGCVELLRGLHTRGTLVFVPTHSSNLDSIALGYALMRAGLPPVVYGAGKNLFSNPIVSFFMHNLGAYRVDRSIQAEFYKDILKTYACVMVERGYHSLFFPGGTRSRSGMIEQHLKLGLLGSAIEAFSRLRVAGEGRPVFFVPTTINYALVLEAETLIEDHLAAQGKARYIIDDDEFSRLHRWVSFFRKLTRLKSACVVRFGQPVDPFGNAIDELGRSIAPHGAPVDPATYVMREGRPVLDAARDTAYTRALGELLVRRFQSETVLMATQIVAHILFRRLVRETPGLDVFARLRHRGDVAMTRSELVKELGVTRDRLKTLQARGSVQLSPLVSTSSPGDIVERVLEAFQGYHRKIATVARGPEIVAEDPTLLLYYQNRLIPFADQVASGDSVQASREISRMDQ